MGIKVFFNDSCNICRFEINHYKKNSDNSLEWVDITNNKDALALTSKSCDNCNKVSYTRLKEIFLL